MSDSFKTFRDPLLSLYQSAVSDVAKKIEQTGNDGRGRRAVLRRSVTSTLPEIAAQIAEREFKKAVGDAPSPLSTRPMPRELSKTGMAQVCAEWGLRYLKALAFGEESAIEQLKNEFTAGTCDPAWLTTLEAYRGYFGSDGRRKAVPYIRAANVGPKTIEIKANARVALMGDWGTGAQPAIEILKAIEKDDP